MKGEGISPRESMNGDTLRDRKCAAKTFDVQIEKIGKVAKNLANRVG